MLKLIGGAVAGVVAWIVIVTLLNLVPRFGWPAYAAVEKAMIFTPPMMIARLIESGLGSLASGAVARRLGGAERSALAAGVIVLLFFLPVHYQLWDRFPIWYHLTFLTSLPLLAWLGGRLVGNR